MPKRDMPLNFDLDVAVGLLADAESADDILELRPSVDLLQYPDDSHFRVPTLLRGSSEWRTRIRNGPVFEIRSEQISIDLPRSRHGF
jgi:hypothetical protein